MPNRLPKLEAGSAVSLLVLAAVTLWTPARAWPDSWDQSTDVDNFIGTRTIAPNELSVAAPVTDKVIIADELRIGDVNYDLGKVYPTNLTIIADHLTLAGVMKVDLSAKDNGTVLPREGGTLTIIAQSLTLEGNGKVSLADHTTFMIGVDHVEMKAGFFERQVDKALSDLDAIADGLDNLGNIPLKERFRKGNSVTAAMREREMKEWREINKSGVTVNTKKLEDALNSATVVDDNLLSLDRQLLADMFLQARKTYPLVDKFGFDTFPLVGQKDVQASIKDLVAAYPDFEPVVSRWALDMFYEMRVRIDDADRRNDQNELVELFRRFSTFPISPTTREDRAKYDRIIGYINGRRKELLPALEIVSINVPTRSGYSKTADVFVEIASRVAKLIPTSALVHSTVIEGRPVWGLLSFDSSLGTEVTLHLAARLIVDSWIVDEIRKKMKVDDGMFSQWSLTARPVDIEGIVRSKSLVKIDGADLDVTLALDPQKGVLATYALLSGAGIPLTFDWTYSGNSSIRGSFTVRLDLRRRDTPSVSVTNDSVKNLTGRGLLIDYVETPNGRVFLPDNFVLAPGETRPLGVPSASIPAEAVVYSAMDALDYPDLFYRVSSTDVVDWIYVTDRLPAVDEASGDSLTELDLKATYQSGGTDGKGLTITFPPLAPAGAVGSDVAIPVMRPRSGPLSILLQGVAQYSHGSQRSISPRTVTDRVITITTDWLKNSP